MYASVIVGEILCNIIILVNFINDTPHVDGNTITAEFRTSKQVDSITCIIAHSNINEDCKCIALA